jgi:ribosome-associated heat shock protein Hsp15
MTEARPAIRLDKWLWHARFCKSRAVAARLIADGAVRVNSVRVNKPATTVKVGDGLSFAQGGRIRAMRVLALGVRRGPAPEAQRLCADLDDTRMAEGRTAALNPTGRLINSPMRSVTGSRTGV